MKHFIYLALTIILSISFIGCNKNNKVKTSTSIKSVNEVHKKMQPYLGKWDLTMHEYLKCSTKETHCVDVKFEGCKVKNLTGYLKVEVTKYSKQDGVDATMWLWVDRVLECLYGPVFENLKNGIKTGFNLKTYEGKKLWVHDYGYVYEVEQNHKYLILTHISHGQNSIYIERFSFQRPRDMFLIMPAN